MADAQAESGKSKAPTPDDLPPAEAEKAREIQAHMPDGREPVGPEKTRSRAWLVVISVLVFVGLICVLVAVGRDLPSLVAILLITLAYALGLLPLIGAALYRRRDRIEAARMARGERP
jgi:hypothetical protein